METSSQVVDEQNEGEYATVWTTIRDTTSYRNVSQRIIPSGHVLNYPYRAENRRALISLQISERLHCKVSNINLMHSEPTIKRIVK